MSFSLSVSIVIPVLNAEPYVLRLMDAFYAQVDVDLQEIILVDSGSMDRTKELAEKCSKVRIIDIKNFSQGYSRNIGARAAKGDIVVFLSQDAVPDGDKWLYNLINGKSCCCIFSAGAVG